MPDARKKEFDFDLHRKFLRHFDNPNTNERDGFILQSLKQCVDCGVLFWDATRQAIGGDDELRARNTVLEAENASARERPERLDFPISQTWPLFFVAAIL